MEKMAEANSRSNFPSLRLPQTQNPTEPPSNSVARHDPKSVTYSPIREELRPNGSTNKEALAGPSTASESTGFPFGDSVGTYQDGENGTSTEAPRLRGIAQQLLLRRASADRASKSQDRATKFGSENSNPQGSPSVQFSPPAVDTEQSSTYWRSGSGDFAGDESVNRTRRGGGALFNRLKAFASPPSVHSHKRTSSGFSLGRDSVDERMVSHLSEGDEPMNVTSGEGESDLDADAEESTGEDDTVGSSHQRRRKSRRPQNKGPQTTPTTPKTMPRSMRPGFLSSSSMTPTDRFRPSFLQRRATTTDLPAERHQGVSEDEGRDKIRRANAWRRGSAWVHGPRGLSYAGSRKQSQQPSTEERRPSNLRRLTGLGASNDGNDSSPFSPWKGHRGERATTISAAKWRQLKAGLRMMGQRRKAENTIDHAKSAELLAELTAGVPAALIVASMFQRDEHGNKRIPILLEQLKVRLTDSQQVSSKSGERHMIFRIEMEYGNGLTRMKWVIHRALRDFVTLHTRYKIQIGAQKYVRLKNADARTKLPRFPRGAFPYLRDARGLKNDSEDEEDVEGAGPSGGETSGAERTNKKKARPLGGPRRKSSVANVQGGEGSSTPARKDAYPERQRKKLELYLQQMIRYLIFRPESNRLCKFLELSALGVRLAAEGSYHGKEGLLIIQSGKGVDFRKAWTPSLLAGRHGPKWFSVRHSYVVCVDSPEEMNIYDVFLVDSSFQIQAKRRGLREHKPKDMAKAAKESASHPKHHSLKLYNSERKLKLLAKTERQLHQFEESIKWMLTSTSWAKPKRFDSFAPVRSNVFAQWLVDGRDYMWNVSRAISMAKDVIYIHDWWLSPELYMRRPAAISQKWRLDRLLQRKAREGVKVFVIMYRNINSAIPIDSEYTKFSLLDLHHNVFVQRSPNQFRQNTFFWAHHEKICIVDHMVAFVGGIDLCFGRWDTPQHSVVDDKLTGFETSDAPKDADHCQLWPGKDYSNPRVQDFYALEKPYEEMYDRSKIPRMPWHDIHMQIVGQPARDLTRHFVQRWNYILRQRKPTRPTPFLLPPPDFQPADLEALGLNGTCEVQILRSACWWSLGTPNLTEHSIMNAYIKTIEQSEHFVYIENQFFISSCEVEGTRIENHIGDALVERIVRASQNREDWRAVIVIPLMPGFQNAVDQQDGTSIRLIMQCQYRSICRGEASIFGRVRAYGIEPEDYIQFYSLRSWGRIGPVKQLVTEQLYIHAKCMVVDDRIAIIGSANINERSMLGSRDSECAAIVRDTDMLWSTMNGEPYLVGRFAHTLRMRLMREHLGIDVDEVLEDDLQGEKEQKEQQWENDMNKFHDKEAMDRDTADKLLESKHRAQDEAIQKAERMSSFNHDAPVEQANNPNLKSKKKLTVDPRITDNVQHKKDVAGEGTDAWKREEDAGTAGRRDTYLVIGETGAKEVLLYPEDANAAKGRPSSPNKQDSPRKRSSTSVADDDGNGNAALPPLPLTRTSTATLGLSHTSTLPPLPMTDDTDIGGPSIQWTPSQKTAEVTNPLVADMKRPFVDKDCMRDPLNDSFFLDTWHVVAENNTKLFRQVFRCMPDNDVKSWKEYKEYSAYAERFSQAQGGGKSKDRVQQDAPGSSGPPGNVSLADKLRLLGPIGERAGEVESKTETFGEKLMHSLGQKETQKDNHYKNHSMGTIEEWAEEANKAQLQRQASESKDKRPRSPSAADTDATIDEKAPLRPSNELKPATTFDSESTTKLPPPPPSVPYSDALNRNTSAQKRRRRATTRSSRREFRASDDIIALSDADDLMKMVQGHLVLWPYDWLAREEQGGNWLYSIDGLAPLEI